MSDYDVVVVGAGPGGYVAAIRCAQLGLKTACVESWINDSAKPSLGGTCLNVGCIPSKALLDSSHYYHHAKHASKEHGINISGIIMDINKMQQRKHKIVQTLTTGIAALFRKNGVDWLQGHAKLQSNSQIEICQTHASHPEGKIVSAAHIIIATGSLPVTLPFASVDEKLIVDSTGALAFNEVPRSLAIIGAGVIGLELGSVWNRLGAEVILLEAAETFLPMVDNQISAEVEKTLRKQGLDIRLGAKVVGTGANQQQATISYDVANERESIVVDKLIVAVGRKPNTQDLNAAQCGLDVDERGYIRVDADCRTNLANVYAIGDVVRGPMLAHKASEEGVAVAERIAGQPGHVDYNTIPWVIYTWPEVAWVGETEQSLKAAGRAYRKGIFPFLASGRARSMGETNGAVKILGDADTDEILGVHIFGPHASELISEGVVAMSFDGCTEDLARIIHAHPSLSEVVHEAALGVDGRALHI